MTTNQENVIHFTEDNKTDKKIIIVLEGAHLQLIETERYIYELANNKRHIHILKAKNVKNINNYRPDILHQCLVHLLESPLNKYGKLRIYIQTHDRQLFYVSPHLKIPKTYSQFESLMVTFLRKYKIKGTKKNIYLLKIVKNDLNNILPTNGKKIGLSTKGKKVVLNTYVQKLEQEQIPITFFIGAVAYFYPTTNTDIINENISISDFSLSAATCCSSICSEFENLWKTF
ncbi:ribosomal RNA small subunit methyltransferase NEP1, putative [Hepatocystis sp. ex Piliocolobus tephrosceles]|nr:ribosomal RNA small subunit methyltransferase NEP1, putative [Hepatocystis sp. ex Piliocolobus tephrosceles]